MLDIWMLARLAALEVWRNRVIPGMLVLMLVLLVISVLLASVTMGSTVNIVMDLGLASMSVISNFMAIILTIQLTQQERENRTLYILLPRVSSRSKYILGKYIGIALTIGCASVCMAAMLAVSVMALGWGTWLIFIQACIATLFEVWIIIAVAMLFSNASGPFLAIFYTFTVDVVSRFSSVIKSFGESVGGGIEALTDTAYYLLPNLEIVNLRNQIISSTAPAGRDMLAMLTYASTEISLILAVTCLVYLRKDLHD